MAQKNAISVKIPETDMAEIRNALGVLQEKLAPHLASLSAQDRMELPKMGDKTVAFVRKSYEYAVKHRELAPAFLDMDQLGIDLGAVDFFRDLAEVLTPISAAVDDSLTLSGSEAYQGALLIYGGIKAAAKARHPNAIAIYEELSTRFPGAPKKRKA